MSGVMFTCFGCSLDGEQSLTARCSICLKVDGGRSLYQVAEPVKNTAEGAAMHTVDIKMHASQTFKINGKDVNVHDLASIQVDDEGRIENFVVKGVSTCVCGRVVYRDGKCIAKYYESKCDG